MLRNPSFANLQKNYLFPEINRRVTAYLEKNPASPLISLGIGDTVEPIHPLVAQKMSEKALALATPEGYQGYGPSFGLAELREKIASTFYSTILPEEITISDGAKPEIGRLQQFFGPRLNVAIQDPAYPVYYDTSVIQGHTIQLFSDLDAIAPFDLLFFCSPNNPTGRVATYEELEKLVYLAKKNRGIILFDAAYSLYIQNSQFPKSIYEIPGSHEVAIEINSFSKIAGFSGIRLGWTVVPKALNAIHSDWMRLISTAFNGASLIAQAGAIGALTNFSAILEAIQKTMHNAKILRGALSHLPLTGGDHAPYIFAKISMNSWEGFQYLLEEKNLISTPGLGFGTGGEGYLRFTAFAKSKEIEEAALRLQTSSL